jgi:hypothetical protein
MTTSSLDSILPDYTDALQRLAEFSQITANLLSNSPLTEQPKATHEDFAPSVLAVLSQRDRIQKAPETDVSVPNGNILHTLSELDRKLRDQASAIAPYTQSADWRASINPDPKAWWWFLETPKKEWCDRSVCG